MKQEMELSSQSNQIYITSRNLMASILKSRNHSQQIGSKTLLFRV